MMSNPEQMQQMMSLSQQLMGGGGLGGASLPQANAAPESAAGGNPLEAMMMPAQRARFADQLSQLMAMGFTNEAVCLRVLAQHNGRVDAALDALLSMGDSVQS